MKRALAERAKQSLPQTLGPPQQPSTAVDNASIIGTTISGIFTEAVPASIGSSNDPPPMKIPRLNRAPIKNDDAVMGTSDGIVKACDTPKSSISPPSPRNIKKGSITVPSDTNNASRRPSLEISQSSRKASRPLNAPKVTSLDPANVDHEDHEEDKASAFYLRHQNRALATELKSLQHAVIQLTEERDIRRQHCYDCIQALHSLQATWTALETALYQHQTEEATTLSNSWGVNSDEISLCRIPPSTGTDDSVEWTHALKQALESLGRSAISSSHDDISIPDTSNAPAKVHRKRKLQQEEISSSVVDKDVLESIGVSDMRIAANIASRAEVLQEFIFKLISSSNGVIQDRYISKAEHEKSKALLAAQKQTLEIQVAELSASRRETVARERRVRRNVYRLGAGMLTSDQVVKTVDVDEEVAAEVELERQQISRYESLVKENEHLTNLITEHSAKNDLNLMNGNEDLLQSKLSHAQADSLRNRIAELEDQFSTMKNSVSDLNEMLKKKEERISSLCIKQLSDDNAEKLILLDSTSEKLKQATKNVEELEKKLLETRTHWAQAVGNEKAALSSMDEMMGKFNKRWCELTGPNTSEGFAFPEVSLDTVDDQDSGASLFKLKQQSKQIIELQHKLDQALENVRQAESTRASLKEALITNSALQSKLDEIRSKYAVVQASRNVGASVSNRPGPTVTNPDNFVAGLKDKLNEASSVSTPREKDSTVIPAITEKDSLGNLSNSKAEKLHRDYRRARKDLAAMTASKEAAKAKLERAEKDRETLAESNARLLKQISEKDEVNAKSLSTILYLKGQTDVLLTEKTNLEQQLKTAGQLALAARLATNAKERVAEEIIKEKQSLESLVEELQNQHEQAKSELNQIAQELAQVRGIMATEKSELANALKRIDELTVENEEQRERTLDLEVAFTKAKREARDAKSKLQALIDTDVDNNLKLNPTAGGNTNHVVNKVVKGGTFTVEQLNMQISVLKSRLACPVCQERDKQCIIMRCRHMHCQQCVDDQISNRSRKCPTCNLKFSEKDVEDIWLNT